MPFSHYCCCLSMRSVIIPKVSISASKLNNRQPYIILQISYKAIDNMSPRSEDNDNNSTTSSSPRRQQQQEPLLHPHDTGVIIRNTLQQDIPNVVNLQEQSFPYLARYGNIWHP